jgi:glutamyl-tRNA synthetase
MRKKRPERPLLRILLQNLIQIKSALSVQDNFSHEKLETLYRDLAEKSGISSGKLIHPTRLAVSGVSFAPVCLN